MKNGGILHFTVDGYRDAVVFVSRGAVNGNKTYGTPFELTDHSRQVATVDPRESDAHAEKKILLNQYMCRCYLNNVSAHPWCVMLSGFFLELCIPPPEDRPVSK